MINSSLHQNIIAAEGGWIVTFFLHEKFIIRPVFCSLLLADVRQQHHDQQPNPHER
jgi:hypothetical protein